MTDLRFAVLGCGFWARYQIAAWLQAGGVNLIAVYNRTRSKAEAMAEALGVPSVYDDAKALFESETVDFVDVITSPETHSRFVRLAAMCKVPVICQKPMAPTLDGARGMVAACHAVGVPLMVHENWRWQHPIRMFKQALQESEVGRPFRAHIRYSNSFPVFENQPSLRQQERFILLDMGSHILDTARYLFGEAHRLYCQTARITPSIVGEDVATVLMEMGDRVTVTCELSYASPLEHDRVPETFILAECERGSVELAADHWVRVTTEEGTLSRRHAPPRYTWADPAYDLVHASMVPCCAHLLEALKGGRAPETSGEDNLRTMELVFGAYESAASGRVFLPTEAASWPGREGTHNDAERRGC